MNLYSLSILAFGIGLPFMMDIYLLIALLLHQEAEILDLVGSALHVVQTLMFQTAGVNI